MILNIFNGGISRLVEAIHLGVSEAVDLKNVDTDTAVLTPIKLVGGTPVTTGEYPYFFNGSFVSSSQYRSYIEYQNKLIWATGNARPQCFNGSSSRNLGITPPSNKLTGTVADVESVAELTSIVDKSSGDLPNVETVYMFLNKNNNRYSQPLELTIDQYSYQKVKTVRSGIFRIARKRIRTITPETRQVTFSAPEGFTIGDGGVDIFREFKGSWYLVGNLANAAATLIDDTEDITANGEFDEALLYPLEGTYQYVYTYYNATDGIESGPSPVSDQFDIEGTGEIQLSNIAQSSDPQVTHTRVYRVGGAITEFSLVQAITTTSLLDNTPDDEIESTLLPELDADAAPSSLNYLVESYAMLFGADGDKVRFTPVGQPDNWPATYFLTFSDIVTGLAAVSGGILVFTKYFTHIVYGTTPTSLAKQLIASDQGCVDKKSIQVLNGTAFWLSTDGVCTSNGGLVQLLSYEKLGKYSPTVVSSAVFDRTYYLNTGSEVLLYDGRFKFIGSEGSTLVIANDKLYSWSSGSLKELFAGDIATFRYLSPKFIFGSVTKDKVIQKCTFAHKGDILIKIMIDDVEEHSKEYSSTSLTTTQVKIRADRARWIQLDISGTGTIYEIDIEATDANG